MSTIPIDFDPTEEAKRAFIDTQAQTFYALSVPQAKSYIQNLFKQTSIAELDPDELDLLLDTVEIMGASPKFFEGQLRNHLEQLLHIQQPVEVIEGKATPIEEKAIARSSGE